MLVNPDDIVWSCLAAMLREASDVSANVQVSPAAVLWPDKEGLWANLLPMLRQHLPQLLTLGEYHHAQRQGPAVYLKCALARTLGDEVWPESAIPILYLPGVSVSELTPAETCPHHLQPIAELVYRGTIWKHPNNRDWTPTSFLLNKDRGLGLNVAEDRQTTQALSRCLPELATKPIGELVGKRLDAAFFNHLVLPDIIRDLLRWLDNAKMARQSWSDEQWQTFCSQIRADYGFDPEKDGDLIGAERLASRTGTWKGAWDRLAESPENYPRLPDVIRKGTEGQFIFADPQTLPQLNDQEEEHLRAGLLALSRLSRSAATKALADLEKLHAPRRTWVWARLGQSPLATALVYLSQVAQTCVHDIGGSTVQDVATAYTTTGWNADAAAWQALHAVTSPADHAAVTAALAAVYVPWLSASAERLQELVQSAGYPGAKQPQVDEPAPGECWLFADGLRFDVAQHLAQALLADGHKSHVSHRWVPMPSVTATAKFAASPIAAKLTGQPPGTGFQPNLANGKSLTSDSFVALMKAAGIQVLRGSDTGEPAGMGWTEAGELDHLGHDHQAALPRFIPEQIDRLRDRVQALLTAGWRRVRVLTDHGWLLVPSGLPKRTLPAHCVVSDSRWARCAVLTEKAQVGLPTAAWHWHPDVTIALAPGIGAFFEGNFYAHGGLSPQECIAPMLVIDSQAPISAATLIEWKWVGLRLRVRVQGATGGETIDLRTKANDAKSSVADQGHTVAVNPDGSATIFAQDSKEGTTAFLVLLDSAGVVIGKQTLEIGA
jgi:hypothetical protein